MATTRDAGGRAGCLIRKPDVILRRIAGEVLLVRVRGSLADLQRLFVLDGVGEFIWERIDGTRSAADLAADLQAEFEVDAETAARDVDEFLVQLRDAGVVEDVGV